MTPAAFLAAVERRRLEEHERAIASSTPGKAIEHKHNCRVCGRGIRAWRGVDVCTKWRCQRAARS